MKNLFKLIKETLSAKPSSVIAIDGMCASGKTTAASRLAEEFGFQIIHMDDFFLPFDMRTEERLSQPGGNVHYERFVEEIAVPLENGRDFEYRVFDCSIGDYAEKRKITHGKPIVIEGAYSTHPEIPDIYDLKIFFRISPEIQLSRIEKRNGKPALKAFKEKWIPFENRYFEAFSVEEKCDIVIQEEQK